MSDEITKIATILSFHTSEEQRCYIRDRLWDLFYLDQNQRTVYDMIQALYAVEGVQTIPYELRNDVEYMESLDRPKH